MINKLNEFLNQLSNDDKGADKTDTDKRGAFKTKRIQLASAALLVEVATIDHSFDDSEWVQLKKILEEQSHLSATDVEAFIQDAQQASQNSASLYEFTQLINQHFSADEKLSLIKQLWLIAYADGHLDKYEEHIIRRIADLIHVSHSAFIQAKITVRDGRTTLSS